MNKEKGMISPKPWLNEDGSKKTMAEIKLHCRSWDLDTWEEYLKTIEVDQRESHLGDGEKIERLSIDRYANLFLKLMSQAECPNLARVAKAGLNLLTPKEYKVIYGLYWLGKNISEISIEMNCARKTVRKIRDAALKKLEEIVISGSFEEVVSISKRLQG